MQDKDTWIPQGSSGYLAQVIRWADCGSGWLHRGPVGRGKLSLSWARVGLPPSGLSDIPQGFGSHYFLTAIS